MYYDTIFLGAKMEFMVTIKVGESFEE